MNEQDQIKAIAVWTDANRQVWASPNGIESYPRYACTTDQDFSLKYYDCLRNARQQI